MNSKPIEHYYIHWPFCKNKCHYCDFVAFEKHDQFSVDYHRALNAEMKQFFAVQKNKNIQAKTLFFGGGTPSIYPLDLLEETMRHIYSAVDRTSLQEVTLEVNPEGVTHVMLAAWKAFGFSRLSIGVQVLDDMVLGALNRKQRSHDVLSLFDKVFQYDFDVSVDLIIGLPGLSDKQWWHTVHTVLQWPITHISVYFLTIHENTPLAHRLSTKELALASDDSVVAMYQKTIDVLKRHGLMQYEISNFACPGKESIHNRAYWKRKEYKGFGLGAASFYNECRFVNHKNLSAYIQQWLEGVEDTTGKAAPFFEAITNDQQRLERYMLGLRQTHGMAIDELLYAVDDLEKQKNIHHTLTWLEKEGFLRVDHDIVRLTPRGMVYENEIVTKLY